MLRLKEITVSNFLSFGQKPTTVDLSEKTDTLIVGNNKDIGDEGESRNGAGKTTILQAVVYAIYGKGIDKLKADEFINIVNEKRLTVDLKFELNGTEYRISRGRKPNFVEFYKVEGGKEKSLTLDSMKNTDSYIEKTINIPYDIFIGVYFLSPHKESFMAMGAGDQRKFIESVLSLDTLASRAEKLKLIRKDKQTDLKLAERDLENAERRNEETLANVNRLEDKLQKYDDEQQTKLKELIELSEDLAQIDFEDQKELLGVISVAKECITEIDTELSEISEQRHNLQIKLDRMKSDITQLEEAKGKAKEHYTNLEKERDGVIAELETLSDMDEVEEQISEISQLEEKESELKIKRREISTTIKNNCDGLERARKNKQEKQQELDSLRDGTCPYCKQSHFDEAKEKNVVSVIEELNVTVEELTQTVEKQEQEYDEVNTEINDVRKSIDDTDIDGLKRSLKQAEKLLANLEGIEQRLAEENPFDSTIRRINGKYEEPINELIEQHENEISALDDIKKNAAQRKTTLIEEIKELEERKIFDTNREIESAIESAERTEKEIMDVRKHIKENPYVEEIETTKNMVVDIDGHQEAYDEIESDIKHIGYLISLLTDSKSFIRKNIVDQYVPFLNKRINEYGKRLGLPHIVEIKSDLSTNLVYARKDVSFYNLSQGERMRLNIATTLAFKDLMGLLGKSCNMMLLDEVLDSALDRYSVRKAFELVKSCADTVWIISHREEFFDIASRVMTVTKSNAFSTIKFD